VDSGKFHPLRKNATFETNDVIGIEIYNKPALPNWRLKQQKSTTTQEQELPTGDGDRSDGTFIRYYKNGVLQPYGHENIFVGSYFAGVSLYMQATC